MSVHTAQAQWSLTQRALSCIYMYHIDCLKDQCNTSIFDLYPLLPRLTGRSLIEFFGHWFSKCRAERQSITVQVTWPSLEDVLYQAAFAHRKLLFYTASFSHTQVHTHSVVYLTTQASTKGENDWPRWHQRAASETTLTFTISFSHCLLFLSLSLTHTCTLVVLTCTWTCEGPQYIPWPPTLPSLTSCSHIRPALCGVL